MAATDQTTNRTNTTSRGFVRFVQFVVPGGAW